MRRFELTDEKSNKFWEVDVSGKSFTVRYGPMGANGKTQTKSLATAAAARAEAGKLVRSKLAKGYVEVGAAAAEPMSERVFWKLIAMFDWKKTGDDDAVLSPAVNALSRMTVADIYAFDEILAAKLYALDTREICRGTYRGELDPDDGDDYVSADDFLYARCVIVANGEKFFQKALANPNKVPQEMEFEALMSVARMAYEKKVGKDYDHVTKLSWESFSNKEGWKPTKKTKAGKFTGANVPAMNRRPT